MNKEYKILSLDGGGIKCLQQAILLNVLENRLGKPLCKVFNMISGTSGGGIIASLLACETPTEEIVNFFIGNEAKKIFKKRFPVIYPYKYSSENINSVLKDRFKNIKSYNCKTSLLITSYNTDKNEATFFTNDDDLYLYDIARATSAAPTYFEPHFFNNNTYVDGGLFANNPAMCAYVEASKRGFKDILLVSIGSGSLINCSPCDKIKNYYPVQWISPLIDFMFDGMSDTVEYQLKHILPKNKYFRFQTTLNEDNSKLDNVEDKNLSNLIELAKKNINNNWSKDISYLISIL